MKGIIFTEFLEMTEKRFGILVADRMIENANLTSGAIYTSIGTYDHQELVSLLIELSKLSKIPLSDLLLTYGKTLFAPLARSMPQFMPKHRDCFDFLMEVDSYIHVSVKKLYPDAELPNLRCERINPNTMLMHYSSCRPFAKVAEGLLLGCSEYFDNSFLVSMIDSDKATDHEVSFELKRTS